MGTGFPGGSAVKYLPANAGDTGDMSSIPWVRKIPWMGKWQPTAVFLLRKSHWQRSLVGYSPQGRKESDLIEHARTSQNGNSNGTYLIGDFSASQILLDHSFPYRQHRWMSVERKEAGHLGKPAPGTDSIVSRDPYPRMRWLPPGRHAEEVKWQMPTCDSQCKKRPLTAWE